MSMGEVCDGKIRGKRIDILPDGTKLGKAFSLFAKNLMIHDEKSHGHWDVMFQNPSGSFCYVYSLDKMKISNKKKFKLVDNFEKCLPKLRRNLRKELARSQVAGYRLQNNELVLAIIVLLKTKMRVGSEIYYKKNRHKGLTTLKKKNVEISGDVVTFDFVGKDGVPQVLKERFSGKVAGEMRKILRKRKRDDFVFVKSSGKPFSDIDFEAGFERFCGQRFYPHIVRSHFATREVEKFLASKKKEDAREFCLRLAGKLGHKKFSKKDGEWKESYEVTLHHYVRPDLVGKIKKLF